VKHAEFVDWRVWKAARVAAAGAPLSGEDDPIQPGDHVYVVTVLERSRLGDLSFITPSPVALALNVAINAAKDAEGIRHGLRPDPRKNPGQPAWVPPAQLGALYQFFERCMIAVTFSFQAIEAFANQLVAEGLTGTIRLDRRDGPVDWGAAEVERRCSTEEKVGVVLPEVSGLKSPKGTKLWENLVKLKDLRDVTIHLKSSDQYVRGRPDAQTLYFQLLNADLLACPKVAVAIIRYYSVPDSLAWLAGAETQL
jgi:hypothetical protein